MSLVAAFAASHAPGITGWPERAPVEQVERFLAGYQELSDRLRAARPELMIVISPEHWANFFLDNMPAFCMGLAAGFEGPFEDPAWLKVPKTTHRGAPKRARDLYEAVSAEMDLSFTEELCLDHGIMVPLHLLKPPRDIPIIPVIVNCLAHPMPPLSRAQRLGQKVGEVVEKWPERVALLATGGISHWPAMPQAGRINSDFDHEFLDAITECKAEKFSRLGDKEIEAKAGPGAHEIRTWLALAGAVGPVKGEVLAYEAVTAWATGCAVVFFAPRAQ